MIPMAASADVMKMESGSLPEDPYFPISPASEAEACIGLVDPSKVLLSISTEMLELIR